MNDMNEQSGNSGQSQLDAGSGGDARAQFEAWAKEQCLIGASGYSPSGKIAWQAWQAAATAARQPVGVEPVAYRYRDGKHWGYCDRAPVDPDITGEPLYAAPPAPAALPVDLSKFRDAVLHAYILATYARFKSQLGELWDLIDTHPQPAAPGGDA